MNTHKLQHLIRLKCDKIARVPMCLYRIVVSPRGWWLCGAHECRPSSSSFTRFCKHSMQQMKTVRKCTLGAHAYFVKLRCVKCVGRTDLAPVCLMPMAYANLPLIYIPFNKWAVIRQTDQVTRLQNTPRQQQQQDNNVAKEKEGSIIWTLFAMKCKSQMRFCLCSYMYAIFLLLCCVLGVGLNS